MEVIGHVQVAGLAEKGPPGVRDAWQTKETKYDLVLAQNAKKGSATSGGEVAARPEPQRRCPRRASRADPVMIRWLWPGPSRDLARSMRDPYQPRGYSLSENLPKQQRYM